jgi:integrase
MLGLLGLRIFEATGADISDLGDEHSHRVLRLCSKGTKVVLVPLPPAVGRAIDRAIGAMASRPILLSSLGTRMDRHAATPPAPAARGVPVRRHHGQRTLNRQLRMGGFADLDQRITTRFTVKPMDLAESASYLGTTWPWLVD